MNRELAYALSFLFFLLSSLFYSNLITFNQQSFFRFDFLSHIAPNNSKTLLPIEACDFSKGQWVWDETYISHQLYDEKCPFLDPGFRCRQNGRNDEGYRKWRWQPDDCDLPRYVSCMFMLIFSSTLHGCMHMVTYSCFLIFFFVTSFCNFEI